MADERWRAEAEQVVRDVYEAMQFQDTQGAEDAILRLIERVEQGTQHERAGLEAIESLLTEELRERFGPDERAPKSSRIYALLSVPRNMARNALAGAAAASPSGE